MVPTVMAGDGATTTELQALPASFDPRGYYYQQQVSMLSAASSSQYAEHPGPGQEHYQTALHLGYHVKVDDAAAGKGLL
jgi:MADS-box transcription factor, plant